MDKDELVRLAKALPADARKIIVGGQGNKLYFTSSMKVNEKVWRKSAGQVISGKAFTDRPGTRYVQREG